MKFSFRTLMIAAASAMFVFSCTVDKNDKDNSGQGGNEDNDSDKQETVIIDADTDYPIPCPRTPFDIYEEEYKASDDGVSVKLISTEDRNFVFECRPGANVMSYRLDVYPLSILYNILIEAGAVDKTKKEVEEVIREKLFATDGSGGYSFSKSSLGDEYECKEFDWMNSNYRQVRIVPDCDYVIAVCGCYDEDCTLNDSGEMGLVFVRTTSQPLQGSPSVDVQVRTGYKSFVVTHNLNTDAAGIYYFATVAYMIDEYIDVFGERAYRDYMRSYYIGDAVMKGDEENLQYSMSFQNPDPTLINAATAVAIDENGTPAKYFSRVNFNLKAVPEDNQAADGSVEMTKYISATYAEFVNNLDPNCQTMYYRLVTDSEAQSLMAATEAERKAYALGLAEEGYGLNNKYFSFDEASGMPTGTSYSETNFDFGLSPATDYRVVFVCKNFYQVLSDLKFSEIFTTKPLERNNPSANKSDLKLKFSNVTVNSAKFEFEYDAENTAIYRFAFVPESLFGSTDRDYMLNNVLLNFAEQSDYILNTWWREQSGYDSYTLAGLDPNTSYYVAYVAEDMDGVLGEIRYASFTTIAPQVGPNPEVEITPVWDAETKTWKVNYNVVKDAERFLYTVQSEDDKANVGDLTKLGTSRYSAQELDIMWRDFVANYGLSTNSLSTSVDSSADKGKILVALVWAVGREENGDEVYSYNYAILTPDGQVKKLKDYYPNFAE
ncbi:MAG: hypothetical protein ACI4TM_00670 [Candidatus Cryptobacteroides sp.]